MEPVSIHDRKQLYWLALMDYYNNLLAHCGNYRSREGFIYIFRDEVFFYNCRAQTS